MNILICEDNRLASRVIATFLKRKGYIIDIASDGNEAMEKIRTGDPDLLITDIHLPYHSGLELIRYMRKDLGRKTPVIIVTAFSDPQVRQKASELGISDYFVKPFDDEVLIDRIASLLK